MEISELEHFLLGQEDADINITSLAERVGMKLTQRVLPKQQGRREEAFAARRSATQETPREEPALAFDLTQSSLVLDAVYAWTSRDRVIARMTTYSVLERQNVFVEMKEHFLSPMDTESIIGVLAWSACDHEGCRRCVALKREKATLMANAKQCVMRAMQEEA